MDRIAGLPPDVEPDAPAVPVTTYTSRPLYGAEAEAFVAALTADDDGFPGAAA